MDMTITYEWDRGKPRSVLCFRKRASEEVDQMIHGRRFSFQIDHKNVTLDSSDAKLLVFWSEMDHWRSVSIRCIAVANYEQNWKALESKLRG